MTAYIQTNNNRRAIVFGAIVLVHFLLGWALVTGLAQKAVLAIAAPLVTDIVEEEIKDETPPPPPPPEMERPPVEVPPPEVAIDFPMETTESTALTDVTDKPAPMAPPPPPPPPRVRIPGRPDMKRMPASEEYYPAASKRNEEQGTATVGVCVDGRGKLTREPEIRNSSGFPRLDEGAIRLAKAGRYIGGTIDGQPDPESCFAFKVKFELKD
ncbi:MAG: energy transducer TonB [Steroidobacteraceae bacterium]|nr:energy transducer TonB [Steroidobacteraceae bacterium]MDW8260052.1 energy transducer TonB [Gammaproteobacteria bacterium]